MDGAWVGGDSEMHFWGDALLAYSREIGLFYKQGLQHLDSNGFIRDPGVYASICMRWALLQMKNLRSPSLTPQAVMEKLCSGSPGFNSCSAICQQCDFGQVMKSLCTS